MSRFVTKIQKSKVAGRGVSFAILAAGCGSKIKSYEPRSLLKIHSKPLIEHQLSVVNNYFKDVEIITVVGCYANKVIKKIKNVTRVVENQIYDETNSSESLRLAFNNASCKNFMFVHGDILFNEYCIDVDYSKSFVITDTENYIKDQEIGLTMNGGKLSILSYGLPIKWAQMAFFTGKEHKILTSLFNKYENKDKKKLSFEIINEVMSLGGTFQCYEPKKKKLLEIDRIKDIQ
jgi:choline kinase